MSDEEFAITVYLEQEELLKIVLVYVLHVSEFFGVQ